jgi:hypothetical protein
MRGKQRNEYFRCQNKNDMKAGILILILIVLTLSCSKSKCKKAIVTETGTPCAFWGIKINNQIYPADSIPQAFKTEGTVVCVDYELYEDMRLCACCGGTWAKIISMRRPGE